MLFCTPVASCYTCVVSCCVGFYSCCPMLCRAVSYCVMLLLVKFSRMDKKKKKTHIEAKMRTWILLTSCLPCSFTIEKFIYCSFLFPRKFVESTCFLKQCNTIGDSSPGEDYFSPSVIWPSLNTKIFAKANNKDLV